MDGSSSPVAVLKNSSLPPGETFTAPTVYSVTRLDNRFVVSSATGVVGAHGHCCTDCAGMMPCHGMPCHAMPCYAMPAHAMPCQNAARARLALL